MLNVVLALANTARLSWHISFDVSADLPALVAERWCFVIPEFVHRFAHCHGSWHGTLQLLGLRDQQGGCCLNSISQSFCLLFFPLTLAGQVPVGEDRWWGVLPSSGRTGHC